MFIQDIFAIEMKTAVSGCNDYSHQQCLGRLGYFNFNFLIYIYIAGG
jgi:hypothetical protein